MVSFSSLISKGKSMAMAFGKANGKKYINCDHRLLKKDMQELSEDNAEKFRATIIKNIRTNHYNFRLSENTIKRKGSELPFIETEQLIKAIYRVKSSVGVKNSKRKGRGKLTNKQLYLILEYGVKDKGIPARPLWRFTFRDFKKPCKKSIRDFFKLKSNGNGKVKFKDD